MAFDKVQTHPKHIYFVYVAQDFWWTWKLQTQIFCNNKQPFVLVLHWRAALEDIWHRLPKKWLTHRQVVKVSPNRIKKKTFSFINIQNTIAPLQKYRIDVSSGSFWRKQIKHPQMIFILNFQTYFEVTSRSLGSLVWRCRCYMIHKLYDFISFFFEIKYSTVVSLSTVAIWSQTKVYASNGVKKIYI